MKKQKVQVVICVKEFDSFDFLLLQMNAKRNSYWQNVTGGVDNHEPLDQAAIRETIEETGLKLENIKNVQKLNLKFCFHDQWGNDVEEFVFMITCQNKWKIKIDPNEHQFYKWVNISQISQNIVHYKSNYQALLKVRELL